MNYLQEEMLIKVSATANNNKFYHVILADNNTIIKRWGRVGSEGTIQKENGNKTVYERLIRSKKSRGYKTTKIITDNSNVHVQDTNKLTHVAHTALVSESDKGKPEISKLIDKLVKINTHEILEKSGGLIKVNTNGVITTPLGLVNQDSIKTADVLLTKIKDKPKLSLIEEYLTVIPQKVNKSQWDSFLADQKSVIAQQEFLEQLSKSLDWYNTQPEVSGPVEDDEDIAETYKDFFSMKVGLLSHQEPEYKRVEKLFNATKNHHHRQSSALKLVNIYTLENVKHEQEYQDALRTFGNEQELWHGTKAFNLLSILRKGLFIPKSNDGIHITGRMFGDGIYFSDQSTKALNYATGYWSGMRNTNNIFMFLSNVVMGTQFNPRYFNQKSLEKAHYGKNRFGKPFNSINVKGGTCGVVNNEMIIWKKEQIKLKYLCEFSY